MMLADKIAGIMAIKGPVICEAIIDEELTFQPKFSSKQLPDGRIFTPTLEELSPFLSREENMIIDLLDEDYIIILSLNN